LTPFKHDQEEKKKEEGEKEMNVYLYFSFFIARPKLKIFPRLMIATEKEGE